MFSSVAAAGRLLRGGQRVGDLLDHLLQLLDALLNEQDIPHLMRSYHDSAYDGLWQVQHGWGHIEAPKSRHEEIRKIYE